VDRALLTKIRSDPRINTKHNEAFQAAKELPIIRWQSLGGNSYVAPDSPLLALLSDDQASHTQRPFFVVHPRKLQSSVLASLDLSQVTNSPKLVMT
jgi:hypothetical protein